MVNAEGPETVLHVLYVQLTSTSTLWAVLPVCLSRLSTEIEIPSVGDPTKYMFFIIIPPEVLTGCSVNFVLSLHHCKLIRTRPYLFSAIVNTNLTDDQIREVAG
jgi:hypothetical protein